MSPLLAEVEIRPGQKTKNVTQDTEVVNFTTTKETKKNRRRFALRFIIYDIGLLTTHQMVDDKRKWPVVNLTKESSLY
jgi:hypothetical protein